MKNFLIALFLIIALGAQSQTPYYAYEHETKEEKDERMAWWREARFGMFIHWGVYAVPAGTYNGEKIRGIGEWIMLNGKIPVDEYKAYAKEFNPVKYDPESWAKLAKTAGMRYMVITSKHHDGFGLFPSHVTDWDVTDATPYGKDLIGPLAEAARAEGLKFGLYYSQAQDWTHPGGSKARREEGEYWDEKQKGDFDEYINQIAIPQVGEILSNYRPDILWWDTPYWMNETRAERLIPLIRIVPDIITNNRLGGGYIGDTETPEQHIPAMGFPDRDWEVCMTMNGTWGYKSYDHNWKSTEDLIRKLSDIVSKGGNFLLNVGPTAEGVIPQASIDRLEEIGAWMDINSEAIYGTSASPFHRLTWGRATKKAHEDGATLYLHVFDWPEKGELYVPGLLNMPKSATLLQGGASLNMEQVSKENPGIMIEVPKDAPDPIVTVIKLEINGELDVKAIMPEQNRKGVVSLEPDYADLHNRIARNFTIEGEDRNKYIGNWIDRRIWVSYTFKINEPGTFEVVAELAGENSTLLNWNLREEPKNEITINSTGGMTKFKKQVLGTLEISSQGIYTIELRPKNRETWEQINLRRVTLKPVK